MLIEGGQISKRGDHLYGADWLAGSWAISRRVSHWTCWPNWHTETGEINRAAGPIRNARMMAVGRPDGVLAMSGGKGTRNMMGQAKAAGVKVWDPLGAHPPELSDRRA